MKKKLLITILAIIATMTCAIAFTACDGLFGGNNQPEDTHTHNWSKTYIDGGDKHYQTCSGCDERQFANHTFIDGVCICGKAEPIPMDGLQYTLSDDGTYYLCSGVDTSTDTEIIIASEYKGKPVSAIDNFAFYDCSSITSITIPDSVTSICSFAFCECTSLTSITFPDSVTSIDNQAFENCSSLSSITIPDSVTSIGDYVFRGCTSLTSVHITDLTAWCKISFSNSYSTPLSYAKNLYLNNELVTNLIIPNSITSIGNYVFRGCSSLESITLPITLTSIGKEAFGECTSLTSISIPDGVTSIASGAFCDCTSLTSVHITDLTAWCKISFDDFFINNPLFYAKKLYLNNELVTNLIIPDDVKIINSYTFSGCTSITSVTIHDGVTSIGASAFDGCASLESIYMENSVNLIGTSAFFNCRNLTSINFNGAMYQWLGITKRQYWNTGTGNYTVHCTDGFISK